MTCRNHGHILVWRRGYHHCEACGKDFTDNHGIPHCEGGPEEQLFEVTMLLSVKDIGGCQMSPAALESYLKIKLNEAMFKMEVLHIDASELWGGRYRYIDQ